MKSITIDAHGEIIPDEFIVLNSGITVVTLCTYDTCMFYTNEKIRSVYFKNTEDIITDYINMTAMQEITPDLCVYTGNVPELSIIPNYDIMLNNYEDNWKAFIVYNQNFKIRIDIYYAGHNLIQEYNIVDYNRLPDTCIVADPPPTGLSAISGKLISTNHFDENFFPITKKGLHYLLHYTHINIYQHGYSNSKLVRTNNRSILYTAPELYINVVTDILNITTDITNPFPVFPTTLSTMIKYCESNLRREFDNGVIIFLLVCSKLDQSVPILHPTINPKQLAPHNLTISEFYTVYHQIDLKRSTLHYGQEVHIITLDTYQKLLLKLQYLNIFDIAHFMRLHRVLEDLYYDLRGNIEEIKYNSKVLPHVGGLVKLYKIINCKFI